MCARRVRGGAFGRLRQATFAEERDGLVHIAVRFGQGSLALHHAGARLVTKLLNLFCADCCHWNLLSPASLVATAGLEKPQGRPCTNQAPAGLPARDVVPGG